MKLETTNPNNYSFITKQLELHILGGLQLNKLESLRVTLSIEKITKGKNVLNVLPLLARVYKPLVPVFNWYRAWHE
ncbi:hypothetical protein LY01_03012 [Nonlabens xylanidelens]|uniref:Uncharacterized protein n=1 Tax=Nonlabens xylanidelens TaxID=191564 RepID=A0A2S6IDF3_9FLAO|nr:hypothetical protein [Nonlabens xylanidelens]PPK92254.1 hypothetical protein LY01_03012 [Nonlabens xylanidelens]PQJ18923.1 hypothetical protein BST94_06810 [Nonlabens xylanidelens]PQJ19519.1 hypothetical protein BST94_06755 [Nonlabens xylanidelens]PQJ23586.1 hypothetical protein BST94_00045 [Nonlabens xylanidelens]